MKRPLFCIALATGLIAASSGWAAARKVPVPTHSASIGVPAQNPALLAQAQARLGWHLLEAMARPGGANITVSPASLASVFGVLQQGANPAMRAAIVQAMGFSGGAAAQNLSALTGARVQLAANTSAAFTSVDRLVFAPSAPPGAAMQARLQGQGVPFSVEDLSQPAAAAGVDAWVSDVTHGAIAQILGGPLDHPGFVALNALHFKSQWQTPFDASRTAPAPFRAGDGKSQPVTMMQLPSGQHLFRIDKTFVAIDLPFSDPRFSLLVVTSADTSRSARDFSGAADWLAGTGFAPRKGDLALPRFSLSGRADLVPVLDALGLAKARHARTALQGFGDGTVLSQVLQRSTIDVDEAGAEAAAATAVITTRALEVDDAVHMVVDRPFIFSLRDRLTGLILIAGYVGQPPAEKAR